MIIFRRYALGRLLRDHAHDLDDILSASARSHILNEVPDTGLVDGVEKGRGMRCLALGLATRARFDIGERKERPSRVHPTGGFQDRPGFAIGIVELVIPAMGVGPQKAAPSCQMGSEMLPARSRE